MLLLLVSRLWALGGLGLLWALLGWAGLGLGLFSRNRNCIEFGSGVLRCLPGFAFYFCNLIFGFGGRLAGSAFCLCFFGWAGLGCRWAATGLLSRTFKENSKLLKMQVNSKRNSHNIYLSCSCEFRV